MGAKAMRKIVAFTFILVACLFADSSLQAATYAVDDDGPAEYLLDQAQEGINYGFWFEKTVIRWQEFKPTHTSLSKIDLYIGKNGNPGNLRASVKDEAGDLLWETTLAGDDIEGSGWIELPVSPSIPLEPDNSYYIYVWSDADSPNPQNRYFWRGQTNSEYDRGISCVESGWPGYDFAFRTWSKAPPLHLSLNIEDALEGVTVNKVVGDTVGPTYYTRVEIVAKLISFSSAAKDDIPVVLTIPSDLFGSPMNTWVRNTSGGALTPVGCDNLGGGQYRVTTDLSPVMIFPWTTLYYRKQIVWRFLIPNDTSPQDVAITAEVQIPCVDPSGNGTIRILAPGSVHSLIIANRKLLYDKYSDSQVSSLLQRLFTEAQGHPASHTPRGVIYYAERYDARAYNWDNTAIDYTSETTANITANAIDDLIEDWHDDATEYVEIFIPYPSPGYYITYPIASPGYLLIVGDDDTIPFYRYNDPYDDEGINNRPSCPAADGWCVDSDTNPAIHATDEDYILTDSPYADLYGGTDWQTGSVELWTGRLLGASAADMLSLLEEGVDWNNGRRGGVVMASVDGWELGLEPDDGRAGEIADLYHVTALFRNKGFVVRNDDIPSGEVQTIDVMAPYEGGNNGWNTDFTNAANNNGGMDLFFIGGHDSYDHANIPGDDFSPDDTPGKYTRFDNDHPIAMIVGCHGGLPVPDIDVDGGVDHCMVHDLIHEGARAYIGATGFSYGSPNNLHKNTWGERLIQRFFGKLLIPPGSNSMAIGKALAEAKNDYTFGYGNYGPVDALDRKTVTEFNLYGVPWAFLYYPNAMAGSEDDAQSSFEIEDQAFETVKQAVTREAKANEYAQTFEIRIDRYEVKKEKQDSIIYDLFSIKGGDTAVSPGIPILPYLKGYTLPLPHKAKVTGVEVLKISSEEIGEYNVPIAHVQPWSEGGLTYTTKTDINYPYPADRDLVQYQETGEGLEFTLYPIQHNPDTDETTFHSYFSVKVTYEAPLSVTVTEFNTDKSQYRPKESICTTTSIANVGDVAMILEAELIIKNQLGETVGTQNSEPFQVPSGDAFVLELCWAGYLGDGAYTVQIALFGGRATMVGGASTAISVLAGEITGIEVPPMLPLGEEGAFKISFANYTAGQISGEARLTIQNSAGGFSQDLPPQPITIAGGSQESATFMWTPEGVPAGDYSAIAIVEIDGQAYGPATKSFAVTPPPCKGDFDDDGDVDGVDLSQLAKNPRLLDLAVFAVEFGRTNCPLLPPKGTAH